LSASPFFIAIAGGTGSGKTTLAKKIHEQFPNSILISQDSYYKDLSHLPFESRKINNFDHLIDLKQGLSIEVPYYDFCQHARISKVELINPANIVIVEGILLLSQPELLSLFDLKIFVDTDSDIRVLRRIERDIEERGRDLKNIREQYLATVKPMHDAFVEPSKKFADIIVPAENINDMALSLILAKISQHEI
jgi:uridine kinase